MPIPKISTLATTLCVAVVLLAAPPPAGGQTSLLSLDELKAAAEQVRAFAPKDQFEAPPPGPDWQGRRFSYVVEPVQRTPEGRHGCSGFPEWSFGNGSLSIAARPESVLSYKLAGSNGPIFPGMRTINKSGQLLLYSLDCVRDDQETYTATNAFGAQLPVSRWTEHVIAIADTDPMDFKFRTYWNKTMSGDEARSLTLNLRVRGTGTLGAWPGGRSIVCGTTNRSPTITSRTDKTLEACIFRGRIDALEFFDSTTGQTLYSVSRKK